MRQESAVIVPARKETCLNYNSASVGMEKMKWLLEKSGGRTLTFSNAKP